MEAQKCDVYPLIFMLSKLVLVLPVSTATIKHAFLAINIVKAKLKNKIEDDFFSIV